MIIISGFAAIDEVQCGFRISDIVKTIGYVILSFLGGIHPTKMSTPQFPQHAVNSISFNFHSNSHEVNVIVIRKNLPKTS